MNAKTVKGLVLGTVFGVAVACGGTQAFGGSENDTTFHEDSYKEFFKQEGHGDKNYLYTITEQAAPAPGKCIVVTVASESAIAVQCNTSSR